MWKEIGTQSPWEQASSARPFAERALCAVEREGLSWLVGPVVPISQMCEQELGVDGPCSN